MKREKPKYTDIRADILEIIEKTFPDGEVDMLYDPDDNYFDEIYDDLEAKLHAIKGSAILYEREPSGEQYEDEDPDFEEDEPGFSDLSASYHLFFLGLTDGNFNYEVEDEITEDEYLDQEGFEGDFPEEEMIHDGPGAATSGCAVGISMLAPVAIITLESMINYESGSYTIPDIEPTIFNMDGTPANLDDHYRELLLDEGLRTLHDLRDEISKILESQGVKIIPEEEMNKPAPWLRPGRDALIGEEFLGREIAVRDAFFFRGP